MKRRLGLLSDQAVDPAVILAAGDRRSIGRRTIGLVAVVPAEPFVDALTEAMPSAVVLSAPVGASAEEVDALVEGAKAGDAPLVLACGEAVVGRVAVDLCVAIDGGRHPAELPAAFRAIRDEAQLILGEPRPGTARAIAALIARADA